MMVTPDTNEIAMVIMCMDLVDHLDGPKGKILYDWQVPIAEAAREMEVDYFRSLNPKRGEHIYVDSTAINPKFMSKNLMYYFWL